MKISACIIMKNEGKHLDRCLGSIRDFVDEIVIVDTGSTDNSIEIAREYGAKVFIHLWQNDFSLHRNQSILYASGDWLLFIDCDEELILSPKINSRKRFKKILKSIDSSGYTAIYTTMIDLDRNAAEKCRWEVPKIFKKGHIEYRGIVHNQPVFSGEAIHHKDIRYKHYGYDLDKKTMDEKAKRTIGLLNSRIEKDPSDYDAHYYLCNYYMTLGKVEKSIHCGEKALEVINELKCMDDRYIGLYHSIAAGYMQKKDGYNFQKYVFEGLEIDPFDVDLNFDAALIHRMDGNRRIMIRHIKRYHEMISKNEPSSRFRLNASIEKQNLLRKWAKCKKIHIAAYSRSGTGYIAKLFQKNGVDIGHEIYGSDGISSWLHVVDGSPPSWLNADVVSNNNDLIFHQVRDPLKVISSSETEHDESFKWREKYIGNGYENKLEKCMHHWLEWNQLIESRALLRYRIEDINIVFPELLEKAGYKIENIDYDVPKNTNSRDHKQYTWNDLFDSNADLARRCLEKAKEYGYNY